LALVFCSGRRRFLITCAKGEYVSREHHKDTQKPKGAPSSPSGQ
jgi:hypothetical protein